MNDGKRYEAAAHAVQSGIAIAMQHSSYKATEPKHLRVGIDLSKAEMEGLATLLMEKGVFTMEEYVKAMADAAEREQQRWEAFVSKLVYADVKLG